MITENLAIGPSVGLAWTSDQEKGGEDGKIKGTYKDEAKNVHTFEIEPYKGRIVMIPLSLFFLIDPIPQYMFHPVVHFSLGYNQALIFNKLNNDDKDKKDADDIKKAIGNGYYNGIYTKFGFDCMIDVGKQLSFIIGPQWQISTMDRRRDAEDRSFKFNAFGLRAGVSILL